MYRHTDDGRRTGEVSEEGRGQVRRVRREEDR